MKDQRNSVSRLIHAMIGHVCWRAQYHCSILSVDIGKPVLTVTDVDGPRCRIATVTGKWHILTGVANLSLHDRQSQKIDMEDVDATNRVRQDLEGQCVRDITIDPASGKMRIDFDFGSVLIISRHEDWQKRAVEPLCGLSTGGWNRVFEIQSDGTIVRK